MILPLLFSFLCTLTCMLNGMGMHVDHNTGKFIRNGKETVVVFLFANKKPLEIVNAEKVSIITQKINSKEVSALKIESTETSAGVWEKIHLRRIGFKNPDFIYKPTGEHPLVNLIYNNDGSFIVQEYIGHDGELSPLAEKILK